MSTDGPSGFSFPCTWYIFSSTGCGTPQTARRIDSGHRNLADPSLEKPFLSCRGRVWVKTPVLFEARQVLSWLTVGVSTCSILWLTFTATDFDSPSDGYARKIHYTCDLFFAL